jgi:hypothetical protein
VPNDLPDWTAAIARPGVQATGSPWVYPAGSTSKNFPLGPDTHSVGLLVPDYQNVTLLEVVGHVSGVEYLNVDLAFVNSGPAQWVPVIATVDTSVDITVHDAGSNTLYVVQVFDAQAVLSTPQLPPPWQAPNQHPTTVHFLNPGPSATVTILPSPGPGQSLYLHGMQWSWDTTLATLTGVWQSSNGTERGVDVAAEAGASRYMDFKGAQLDPNTAFQFHQTSDDAASSAVCHGCITYSIL